MHHAASLGNNEVVHLLVDARADVNAADAAGRTPCLVASKGGHAGAVSAIMSAGADVCKADRVCVRQSRCE